MLDDTRSTFAVVHIQAGVGNTSACKLPGRFVSQFRKTGRYNRHIFLYFAGIKRQGNHLTFRRKSYRRQVRFADIRHIAMLVTERFLVELEGEGCFSGIADDMEVGEHIFLTSLLYNDTRTESAFVFIGG